MTAKMRGWLASPSICDNDCSTYFTRCTRVATGAPKVPSNDGVILIFTPLAQHDIDVKPRGQSAVKTLREPPHFRKPVSKSAHVPIKASKTHWHPQMARMNEMPSPEDLAMIICRLFQCHESMEKPNESSCIPHNRKYDLLSFVTLAVRLPCHICWLHFGNTSACSAAAGTDALYLQLRHHDSPQSASCRRQDRGPKHRKHLCAE